MAAVTPRAGSRRRRAMNDINMVPFIDVMLVLLIIFMVTAPLITTAVVDLPSVGKAQQQETRKIDLTLGKDERLTLQIDQKEPLPVTLAQLAAQVRLAQAGDEQVPVVISADRNVKYDSVVKIMDTLQRAGIKRVGLAVKQGG
jgi:biopolymer transport protein TolR